jgi:CIC family chloride channel protein
LTGIISFFDYQDVLFDENLRDLVIAKELTTTNLVTASIDDNLYDALQMIARKYFSILPVVSADNPPRLVGVLSRRDIIGAYNKAVLKKSLFEE